MNLNKVKMKKITMIACSILFSTGLFAQENLVANGSFEDNTKVRRKGAISQASGWASATGVKADLYVPSTKVPDINTPKNAHGTEEPKDGECYAGIVAYSYGNKVPRSYITTRLTETLKKGKKYCISYHVSLAEGSKYAINQMGMLFSKREFESDSKAILVEEAQLKSKEIHNAQYGWDKICGVFIAKGGEKYLTLGNFNATQDIKSEKNKPPKGTRYEGIVAAYYYIDDVVVYEMDEDTPCDCVSGEAEVEYSSLIYQKQITIDLDKSTPKQAIEAQEIFFGFGQNTLTPLSKKSLDLVAKMMMENPSAKIQINGHTDEMEDEVGAEKDEYSEMDNKRIAAVMEYLKSKSIASERMIPSTQGSDDPNPDVLDSDDEEVAQAKNRRVTFIVR